MGDFSLINTSHPLDAGYPDAAGNLRWTLTQADIMDTAQPFAITYHLELEEGDGWMTNFWYTTEHSLMEVQFTPGSRNPFYWTMSETEYNAFTLNMNWNNGTGLNSGTITDNILGQTFSFGPNTSPNGQTAAASQFPRDWAYNARSLGEIYYWHLEWVKGEVNRTFLFTIRDFDVDLDGNPRNLVFEVHVTGTGGNISGAPGGRTITGEAYFRRTHPENSDVPFGWQQDGSLIQRTEIIARVMLTCDDEEPEVGTLTVKKLLAGWWEEPLDWSVDETTLFRAILTNENDEYVVLIPRPDVGVNYFDFSGFTSSPTLATPITFSVDVPATIRELPAGMMYFKREIFDYEERILELISDYDLIKTTISVNGGPFANPEDEGIAIEDEEVTDVTVRNYYEHGIGFLEVFKLLDGFPGDWGMYNDEVFYVRIWDVAAENYLLFRDLGPYHPGAVPGAWEFWCIGNHELGLTEVYMGTPRLEIPVSVNDFARLSNLWTWGEYEVREVRRVADEATANAAWALFWATADRIPFSGGWNPTWIDNNWLDDTAGQGFWDYVEIIENDADWHNDHTWNWGVIYSEGNGSDVLHLGETVTVTVTNRYKPRGGTVEISKELCANAANWGITGNTQFYVSMWTQDDDIAVFIPDGTGYFHLIGFIDENGVYTVLCPVGMPTPPSSARTRIPFSVNSPVTLTDVPTHPYSSPLLYITREVFPSGHPNGFVGEQYFIVDGASRTPVPAGGFPVPSDETVYITILNNFAPAFRVIYHGNGNTGGTSPVDGSRLAGSTVTVLGQGDLTRDGFTFGGWNTQPGGGGTTRLPGSIFTMPGADVHLYAIWVPIAPNTYTVTYHGNGHTSGAAPIAPDKPYAAGEVVTVLGPGSLYRDGYIFIGWSRHPAGGGTLYQPGNTFQMPAHHVRVYAQWRPVFRVIYDGNGHTGGTEPADTNVHRNAGDTVTVLGPGDLTRDGYIFLHWNTQADGGGTTLLPGSTVAIPIPGENINLFAIWQPVPLNMYTVTYHGNGNTGGTAPVDPGNPYAPEDPVAVFGQGTLVRDGYTFLGWTTHRYGYGGIWLYPGDTFQMPARNVRLYAQWQRTAPPTFTVTYNGNGNTGGTAPVDANNPYTAGTAVIILSRQNLVRTGYQFIGWSRQASGGTLYQPGDVFTMPAENVTFFAQWRLIPRDRPPRPPGQIDPDYRPEREWPSHPAGPQPPWPPPTPIEELLPNEPVDSDHVIPPTGDDNNIALWAALLFIGILGLLVVGAIGMRMKTRCAPDSKE